MRVSIALAAYNGMRFIEKQLDSLRTQIRPADEVVISDDHSTDGTAEFCRNYISQYNLSGWHVITNSANGGFKRNFRNAISNTTGDLILLCDQDDVWNESKILRFEEIATVHPDAAGIACSFSCIDAEGRSLPITDSPKTANHGLIPYRMPKGPAPFPNDRMPETLFTRNIAMGCCMGFRRDICSTYLSITECAFPHDWELALIAALQGKLYFTDEQLIRYRLHGSNTIGLPGIIDDKPAMSKKPSLEGRMKVMDELDALLVTAEKVYRLSGKEMPTCYKAYAGIRREAIEKHSIVKWIGIHKYHRIYSSMFSLKQRLGDLYTIIKK